MVLVCRSEDGLVCGGWFSAFPTWGPGLKLRLISRDFYLGSSLAGPSRVFNVGVAFFLGALAHKSSSSSLEADELHQCL